MDSTGSGAVKLDPMFAKKNIIRRLFFWVFPDDVGPRSRDGRLVDAKSAVEGKARETCAEGP